MFISITEFSKERNIDRDTVNAWIRRHEEVNQSCLVSGKDKIIDTESAAYENLCKKYPLPQLVQVVEDKETKKKLEAAQELIVQLQKQIIELQQDNFDKALKLTQAEAAQQLLEDKEQQLTAAQEKNEELKKELDETQAALRQEKDKSWIDKLFKR